MDDKSSGSDFYSRLADLKNGAHVCSVYGEEKTHGAFLAPFVAGGLRHGQKVLYIAHSRTSEEIFEKLAVAGFSPAESLSEKQFALLPSRELYFKEGGFSPDAVFGMIEDEFDSALREGFSGLRIAGEMEWAVEGVPGSERLVEYEAKLNSFLAGKKGSVMCQYDGRKFPPETLLDVLSAHPLVAVNSRVCHNSYYVPADKFFEKSPPAEQLRFRLEHLEAGGYKDRTRLESEKLFRGFVANVPGIVYRCALDEDWTMEYMSDEVEKITGYSPEDFLGGNKRSFASVIHPDDRALVRKAVDDSLAEGKKHFKTAYRIITSKGDIRHVEENGRGVFDGNGKLMHLDGVIMDVTGAKLAEDSLRESEKRFKDIASAAGEYLWELDENNRYVYASPRMAEIFQRPIEDILGSTPFDFMPDAEAVRLEKLFGGIAAEKKPFKALECMFRIADGEVKWESVSGVPVFDKNGKFSGYRGTALDITKRKKAEEENRVLLNRIEFTLKLTKTGINIIDAEYNMVYIDPVWQNTYGEYEGRKCYEYFMDRKNVCPDCRAGEALAASNPVISERTFPKEAGRCVQTTSFPFTDEKGKVLVAQVNTDITQRKKSERRINYFRNHDSLTGLFNRVYSEKALKNFEARENMPLSLMVFDVNGLRLVNDSYGQSIGDALLLEAARLLRKFSGRKGVLARRGADEFIIIKPKTSRREAQKIIAGVREAAESVNLGQVPLSLSAGFAVRTSLEEKIPDVLKEAEKALDKNKLQEGNSVRSSMINTLLNTLEVISNETNEHTRRLREIALKLGQSIKLSQQELDRLSLLVTLHDIGKIAVPEAVLVKKEKLTEQEWKIIKKHSETGFKIASATKEFSHVAEEILKYHERWDGAGYPAGIAGENIPVLSRIGAIVDAFDAMTNDRPYRKAMSVQDALSELKKCAGTQFDPALVEKFILLNVEGSIR